jgi:hypothetical protein
VKQARDAKGRFLPKPKENTSNAVFTEQDILNAYKAGIADSGKGLLLPSKKAELYLRSLKRHT